MAGKNLSLEAELRAAERRLAQQEATAKADAEFLSSKQAKDMPATCSAVRTRLKRTEAALALTRELVAEIRKGRSAPAL